MPVSDLPAETTAVGTAGLESNRGISAHFQLNSALGKIHINLSAKGERHKFWFDLNTEDYFVAIKGMLEVFDRMVKDATEWQNAKTREWWRKRKSAGNSDPSAQSPSLIAGENRWQA